jgi:hypothetical protein
MGFLFHRRLRNSRRTDRMKGMPDQNSSLIQRGGAASFFQKRKTGKGHFAFRLKRCCTRMHYWSTNLLDWEEIVCPVDTQMGAFTAMRRSMRYRVLAFCVFLMVGCSRGKDETKPLAQQPQEAASSAMNTLQKLVNDQNYKSLGFETVDEVKRAQLGQPLEVYNIGLEKLKDYQAGQEPDSLLTPSAEMIYPVTVGGDVRTGVTIIHKEQGYESLSFGRADVVKRLAAYRQSPAEFVVRIPAFNMYFVGRRVDKRVMLVPITNNPRLKVQAGEAAHLEAVMGQLRPYIDSYNGIAK